MKCIHCGHEGPQSFAFCPICGGANQPITAEAPAAAAPYSPILAALQDKLFLVICILISAACGLSLVYGTLPLLNLLMAIFLWLTYAQSRKGIADARHLRQVSGTVYATYVITYVLSGLIVLIGILFAVTIGAVSALPQILESLLAELEFTGPEAMDVLELLAGPTATVLSTVLFITFTLVGAAVAVVNFFSLGRIHKFAKSAYQSLERGTLELRFVRNTQSWLIVFAVFSGLSALTDPTLLLQEGCLCALYIVATIWLKKYFPTK